MYKFEWRGQNYKTLEKCLTMEKIYKASKPSFEEKEHFIKHWSNRSYLFFDQISIDKTFIKYAKNYDCFMRWLEDYGYIKKIKPEFEPFDLILRIEKEKDLLELWRRLNVSYTYPKKAELTDNYSKPYKEERIFDYGRMDPLKHLMSDLLMQINKTGYKTRRLYRRIY